MLDTSCIQGCSQALKKIQQSTKPTTWHSTTAYKYSRFIIFITTLGHLVFLFHILSQASGRTILATHVDSEAPYLHCRIEQLARHAWSSRSVSCQQLCWTHIHLKFQKVCSGYPALTFQKRCYCYGFESTTDSARHPHTIWRNDSFAHTHFLRPSAGILP